MSDLFLDLITKKTNSVAVRLVPRTAVGDGSGIPPLPPKPVKMGANGDASPEPQKPVAQGTATLRPAATGGRPDTGEVSQAVKAAIDAMVANMLAAGDIRYDRNLDQYVSTGVRWRFPS